MVTVRSLRTGIKYKETPIGKIPVDWEALTLSNVAEIMMGQSPPSQDCHDQEEGLPFYQGNADFGSKYPNPRRWCDNPLKKAQKGDILISVRAPVGEVNIAPHDCIIGRGLGAIRATKMNQELLYQSVLFFRRSLEKVSQGSTFEAINSKELSTFLISVPPLIEQKRIADILTTIDNAIEQTDKIIEKSKELKRGLMQKLLTRGIGHKKFKKTEIGKIPAGWQVCNIEKVASTEKNAIKAGPFGSALKKSIFVDKGYKVYGQEQVIPDDFSVGNYYINEETFNNLKDFAIQPGDILISLVGTFGKVSVVPKDVERGIINPRLIKITLDSNKVLPFFFKYLMTSELMQNQMSNYTHGLTMGILNTKTIKMLVLPIPSLKEQKKITEVLTAIDAETNIEQNQKNNLESLKKSLMQVLLTGKVRVQLRQ